MEIVGGSEKMCPPIEGPTIVRFAFWVLWDDMDIILHFFFLGIRLRAGVYMAW